MTNEKKIIHTIFTLSHVLRSDFEDFLRDFNLSVMEGKFLIRISEGKNSAAALIQYFQKHKTTITQKIQSLEQKGFIVAKPSPEDRREKILSLTEKGRSFSQKIKLAEKSYCKQIFTDFSKEEIELCGELLTKIKCYEK